MNQPQNARDILALVHGADISKDDWWYPIIIQLPDYWQGYFDYLIGELGNAISSHSEEFRDQILTTMRDGWRL